MRNVMTRTKEKAGFTLAELLVVVAIVVALTALALPMFLSGIERSNEESDTGHMRAAYALAEQGLTTGELKAASVYYYYADGRLEQSKPLAGYGKGTAEDAGGSFMDMYDPTEDVTGCYLTVSFQEDGTPFLSWKGQTASGASADDDGSGSGGSAARTVDLQLSLGVWYDNTQDEDYIVKVNNVKNRTHSIPLTVASDEKLIVAQTEGWNVGYFYVNVAAGNASTGFSKKIDGSLDGGFVNSGWNSLESSSYPIYGKEGYLVLLNFCKGEDKSATDPALTQEDILSIKDIVTVQSFQTNKLSLEQVGGSLTRGGVWSKSSTDNTVLSSGSNSARTRSTGLIPLKATESVVFKQNSTYACGYFAAEADGSGVRLDSGWSNQDGRSWWSNVNSTTGDSVGTMKEDGYVALNFKRIDGAKMTQDDLDAIEELIYFITYT